MEPHVSAWFNRPLSSCKRRQDCQVLEGCTARVTPLRIQPLSPSIGHCHPARDGKIAKCWRGVQPGLRLCRYNPCLQVEQKGCNIHICGGGYLILST